MSLLARKIIGNWSEDSRERLRVKGTALFNRKTSLRDRIDSCIFRLRTQKERIEESLARLQRRDRDYFEKCVAAQVAKDSSQAALYAIECADVRKVASTTMQSELALEQIVLRLETVQQFADLVDTLTPVLGVLRAVRHQIDGILPGMSCELGTIIENLDNVMIEVGEAPSSSFDINASSEEARRVLTQAVTMAEERMRQRFPELSIPISATGLAPTEESIYLSKS